MKLFIQPNKRQVPIIFIALLLTCFFNSTFAQQQVVPSSPKENYLPAVPNPSWFKILVRINETTPDWAVMMYGEDPNVFEVKDAYDSYFEKNKWQKDIHVRNYMYWSKSVRDYINEDGFIRPPSAKQQQAYLQKVMEDYKSPNRSSRSNMTDIWTAIGPFETYKDGSTTAVSAQANVYEMDQSNSHPDTLYAATEGAGIYKSIDRGLNWFPVSLDAPFVKQYGALEIHPTNPDIVIVVSLNLIYRTTNGGTSWTQVGDIGNNLWADDLKFHPTQPDSVFLVGMSGLYLSTDGGATWNNTGFTTDRCRDIDFHPTNSNILYLLKDNTTALRTELFKSTDRGATWTLKDSGYYTPTDITNAIVHGGKIAVTPANPDRVYVGLIGESKANDVGWIGVVRSDDSGETWTIPAGQYGGPYQPANTMPWNIAGLGTLQQEFYNFDLEASPTNADLLWVGTIRLSESTDGGVSFVCIGAYNSTRPTNIHSDIQDIEVGVNGELWVATDGGIDQSTDNGQSFTSRKTGINGSEYWGFGSGWNEDVLVGGRFHNGNSAYYQSYGVGNSIDIGGTEESTGYINPLDNKKAYFWIGGSNAKTIVQSVPDAIGQIATTQKILQIKANSGYLESESSGFYFDPRYANHYFVGSGSSIYKSTNSGESFQALNDFGSGGKVLEIAISRKNPDYIYLVFKPSATEARSLYRTTNGGASWNLLTNIPATNRNKLEITLNPLNENEIWVCSVDASNGQKVYQSTDGGTTWINKTTSTLDGQHTNNIVFQGGTNSVVYLATRLKIFHYDQNTNDWIDYSLGLPARPQILLSRSLAPFYRDKKLRLATSGWGIWEAPLAANSQPIAQPITYNDTINCTQDTIQFDSYSIVHQSGVTWQWTFSPTPQWVSSTTARNPKVVFGSTGNYDVSLTVTQGGNSHSKAETNMVHVLSCPVDTIPIQAIDLSGNTTDLPQIPALNLNSNSFTLSAWIKPDSVAASAVAGIVFNRSGSTVSGLRIQNNNRLHYEWNGQHSGWSGGPIAPANEWSHVTLVIEPNKATIYLNGVPYVNTAPHSIEAFAGSTYIGRDPLISSWNFNGKIDELCIWKRSLTQQQVRELMHLTKEDFISTDPTLLAYYQFNEIIKGRLIDKSGSGNHIDLGTPLALVNSSAPVGGGNTQVLDLNASQYFYNFPQAGAAVTLSNCGSPNGQIAMTRLNVNPDNNPNNNPAPQNYWVFRYFDAPNGFNPLENIELTVTDNTFIAGLASNANNGVLHTRPANAEGTTWAPKSRAINLVGNTLQFGRPATISNNLQIGLSNNAPAFSEVDPGSVCQPDTIPGLALDLPGNNSNYAALPNLNLNSNTVTISAWIKPDAIETSIGGIVFCRAGSTISGLRIQSNNRLHYQWNDQHYGWTGGPSVPANEWSHVALVIEPTKATVYLNGVPFVNNVANAVDEFNGPTNIGYDPWLGSDWAFDGKIDEVCIWSRSLAQNEVRELMHLTKEDIIATDINLVGYYQFNETSGTTFDKSGNGNNATLIGSPSRLTSTAPVGGGTSNLQNVTSGGLVTFAGTGVSIDFPTLGTYPNGELVLSKINVSPDQNASNTPVPANCYWVLNNYGTNTTFTQPNSITFSEINNATTNPPAAYALFKRPTNAFGNSWTNAIDQGDSTYTNSIRFDYQNSITSAGQLMMGDDGVRLNVKAFLQGPYVNSMMNDQLRIGNPPLIPSSEPYIGLNTFTHLGGGGHESFASSVLNTSGNNAIVDWVFLELRDKNNPSTVLHTRSALLQRDGDVVDIDGQSAVSFGFANADNYFISIRHRNHLGVRSANTVSLSGTATTYDFTTGLTQAYNDPAITSNNAMLDLGSGIFGLHRSDVNSNNFINVVDFLLARTNSNPNQTGIYGLSDVNMDGNINIVDFLIARAQSTPNKTAHY